MYWTDGRERRIHKIRRSHSIIEPTNYSTSLGSVSAVTRRTEVLVELANVHQVVAFGTNFQPLPSQYTLLLISWPHSIDFAFLFL